MNKETFTKAMIGLLPNCEREAIPIWSSFAAECVENEQFVDFVPETNKAAAIEKWLDCIYTGIYFVKKRVWRRYCQPNMQSQFIKVMPLPL